MIGSFYGRWLAVNLMAIIFIIIAILTYGSWFYFDLFAIAVFTMALLLTRFQINIASTILVITLGRAVEFISFSILSAEMPVTIIIYAITAGTLVYCKSDKLINFVLPVFIACIASEIFWKITHYQSPQLFFSWLVISIGLLTRKFLILRPYLVHKLIGKIGDYSRLDWKLRKVYGLAIIIESTKLIEYLVRHVTNESPLIVYTAYPIIMHGLSCFCLWMVYRYTIELTAHKKMIA
jgi:hypothetical protein